MSLLGGAVLVLSSCVYPYAGYSSYGTLNRGYASPPLRTNYYSVRSVPIHRSYYSGSSSYATCAPTYSTAYRSYTPNYARPYYSNYGYGRPYSGSTWYQPYTSTWRNPGYTSYYNYSSPLVSYGYPMSHNGGWSYSRYPINYGNSFGYGNSLGFGNSFGRNFCY